MPTYAKVKKIRVSYLFVQFDVFLMNKVHLIVQFQVFLMNKSSLERPVDDQCTSNGNISIKCKGIVPQEYTFLLSS